MASPSNMPPWPGVTEPLSFPGPTQVVLQPQNITDSDLILARLREQIAARTQDLDVMLGAIAIAAQAMTDATGAALGMRRDGTVACVGRSGETAPALGARLSENSGISGECLRNGRSQRCDDTETDARVDAEVCRHLGLRSIAAVPIRSRLETVGILEVFSTSARAFTEEHLAHLSSLAELADAASSTGNASADTEIAETEIQSGVEPTARPDLPILTSHWTQPAVRKPIWRYLAAVGAVVVLALFSYASWRMWSELRSRNAAKALATPSPASAPTTETQLPAEANLLPKSTPEQIASTGNGSKGTQKGRVVQAANLGAEPDDGLIRSIPTQSTPPAKISNSPGSDKHTETEVPASTPPQVAMVTTPDDTLSGILANQTTLPMLSPRVSQGASPVVLVHKVIPSYPRDARIMRMEGVVVVRATVTDAGQVLEAKLISGDPILGRAATDAIRQWRYRPALLNGKPVQIETDITLKFKLP